MDRGRERLVDRDGGGRGTSKLSGAPLVRTLILPYEGPTRMPSFNLN